MAHLRNSAFAATLSLGLLLASCGSGVGNAGPRIATVPAMSTGGGGAVFSVSLAGFVTDPEGDPLTYAVLSGGGAFVGPTYSNMFDTLGTYTVQFMVADNKGKTATGTFTVTVNTANLAVVPEGDNLLLLDSDTEQLVTVTSSTGFTDTFRATLTKGHVIYQRTNGSQRLFVFDPNTRLTATLGNSPASDAVYITQTADHRVVFTRAATATPADTDLFIWNSLNGLISPISAAGGVADGNPFVTSTSLVYYQTGTPSDVYRFDPTTNASTLVASGATAETLNAVLPNDGVVYSRVGGGGELDLFYYTIAGGEVEVGADLGATILGQTKTYRGTTSSSQVVFEVTGATDLDIYIWDPAIGASTTVLATAALDDNVAAITALDEVVISTEATPTDNDLRIYTHGGAPAVRVVSATGDNEVLEGSLGNGNLVYRVEAGGGDELHQYDTSTLR